MPIFLDRETYEGFLADSVDQQAKLTLEDLNAPRPPRTPSPSPPVNEPLTPEELALNAPPEPPPPPPEPPPVSTVPAFDSFLAAAGLGPQAAAPPPAPTPVPTPAPTTGFGAGGPPDFNSLLQSAGINIGQGASELTSAVRGAVDKLRPPSFDELMRNAGMLESPSTTPMQPVEPHTHSLPHSEEPASATDLVDVGGKWKTQFDFGSTYTGNYRTGTPHRGIDLVPQKGGIGTAVEAFADGTVTNIARDSGAGGLMVYVQDGQGLTHTYMHLAGTAPGLAVGQQVARGQPIAQMGESGTEGSPHLHYEVRKNAASGDPLNQLIDPRPYITGGKATGTQIAAAATGPTANIPTTAGISGGGERSGRFGERGQWIMGQAAQAASWLGAEGQKALQAILVTEGGLDNARGDNGQSVGPLQFYSQGQLANLARFLRVPMDQAMTWVEQHPTEAVQWAVGTPDNPGYIGRALQNGIQQGLSGADLATYAQRTGQVSVSPERAGANYNALFGGGQGLTTGAATEGMVMPGGRPLRGAELAQQGAALTAGLQPGGAEPESPLAAQQRRTTAELQEMDRERAATQQRRAAFGMESEEAAQGPLNELRMAAMQPAKPLEPIEPPQPAKPVWSQIGDTIGSAISQGLQPIVEMFQQTQAQTPGQAPTVAPPEATPAATAAPTYEQQLAEAQERLKLPAPTPEAIAEEAAAAEAFVPGGRTSVPVLSGAFDIGGEAAGGIAGAVGGAASALGTTAEDARRAAEEAGLGEPLSALGSAIRPAADEAGRAIEQTPLPRIAEGVGEVLEATGGVSEKYPSGGPLAGPVVGGLRETTGMEQQVREFEAIIGMPYPEFERLVNEDLARVREGLQAEPNPELTRLRLLQNDMINQRGAFGAYARAPKEAQERAELTGAATQGIISTALVPGAVTARGPSLLRAAAASVVDPLSAPFFGAELAGRGVGKLAGQLPSIPPTGGGVARIVEQVANYAPGTPEARVEEILRDLSARSDDKLAHIEGQALLDRFRELNQGKPGPFTTDAAVAKGGTNVLLNSGGLPGVDDVRALADAGMVHKDWYSQFAGRAAELVGEDNLAEFFTLFAITSSQTKVKRNVWETLNTMQKVRETADAAAAQGLNVEDEVVKMIRDKDQLSFSGITAGQKRAQVEEAYLSGISEVKSGAKTSSYSGNLQSAGQKLYDPRTTNDVWVWRAFNVSDAEKEVIRKGEKVIDRPWESAVASSDPAYRFTEAVLNEVAREKGLQGHQIQAAMWAAINSMSTRAPDLFQRYKQGDFQGAIRELNARNLVAPDEAYSAGVFDSDAVQKVLQGADRLRAPGPMKATEMTRQFAGKGKPPRPSGAAFREVERTAMEARAPIAEAALGGRALEASGLDPVTRTFPWLSVPHRVQLTPTGALIHLPGGNSDTARYVGAEVAQRTGVEEFTVHAPTFDSTDTIGMSMIGSVDEVAALAAELEEAGIGVVRATTGQALQIPLSRDAANAIGLSDSVMLASRIMQAAGDAGIPADRIIKYAGRSERVGAESFERVLGEHGGTFGAAGRPGVPAGADGGLGPAAALTAGLPARPPSTARALAGRAATGATAGALAAAQEEGATPQDILRGGVQGSLLTGGRAALGRAGLRAPARVGARVASIIPPEAGGERMYHGGAGTFDRPDASRFDPDGLYGPGYYLTSDPRVAGGVVARGGEKREVFSSADYLASMKGPLKRKPGDVIEPGYAQQRFNVTRLEDFDHTRERISELRAQIAESSPRARVQLEKDLASHEAHFKTLQASGAAGANVRPINVPPAMNMLDMDAPARGSTGISYEAQTALEEAIVNKRGWAAGDEFGRWAVGVSQRDPRDNNTNHEIFDLAKDYLTPAEINAALAEGGYDGISYSGGRRIPMRDAGGKPIQHKASVVFAESMDKLTNAVSGTRGGLLEEAAQPSAGRQVLGRVGVGATAGATAAAREEGATPEDVMRGGVQGGLLAGGRAALGRAGLRAPMRTAARIAAEGGEAERMAPAMGGGTTGISQSPTFLRESLRRMYPGAINKAAAKEALQNSVDASRGMPGATTTINVDNTAKTISIVDQGKGMTPQIMEDVFVKLGGSSKSAGSAGGMGTAIKAIMANAEDTWVRTIGSDPNNPGKYTDSIMHGSGDDFLNGTMHRYYAPEGEMPYEELAGAPREIVDLDYGPNRTGTAIWTKPMDDVNWDPYTLNSWISNFNRSSRVPDQNVEFVVDGQVIDAGTQIGYSGPRAIADSSKPTQLLKTISTPGAEIDFYGSAATSETGYAEVKLLNNGQYQADQFVQLPGNAKLPTTLVADVRSTVDPKGVGYPWTADRNSLIDTAQKAIKEYVGDELARDLISQENLRIGDSIRNAPNIGMVKLVDDAGIADSYAAETLAAVPKHRGYRNLANLTNDLHESLIAELEGRMIPAPGGGGTIGPSHLVGLGVSDKWLGLNVPPSYTPWHASGDEAKGILIEPWQIWKEVERGWPNASREEQISRYTDGLLGTMLHEISHNTEIGGHSEGFAGLLTRIPQFLGSKQQQAITTELRRSLAKTWDTLADDLARDATTFGNAAREGQLERYGTSARAGDRPGRPAVAAGDTALHDQGGRVGGRPPGGAALPAAGPAEGRPPQALEDLLPEEAGLPTTPPTGGRPLEGVRKAIEESPAGPVLGALRGPGLLSNEELISQATPRELELARKGATLVNKNPTDDDVADFLRGSRIGEAAAGERATSGVTGAMPPGIEPPRRAGAGGVPPPGGGGRGRGEPPPGEPPPGGRGAEGPTPPPDQVPPRANNPREFDLEYLAEQRRQERSTQPPLSPEMGAAAKGKPSKVDYVVAYTVGNMLSGMGSAVQNTIGGVVNNLYRPLETFTSGRPTDAMRDVAAQFNALGEAFSRYGHTLKTGERTVAPSTETAVRLPGGMKNPLNWALANLGATDEFMGALAVAGEEAAEVNRLMRLNPTMAFDEVVQGFRGATIEAGARARREATFTEGGGIFGKMGERFADQRVKLLASDNKHEVALGIAMQWLLPMTRVPGVILGKGVRALPGVNEAWGLGEAAMLIKQGKHREARRVLARTGLTTATNVAILDQVIKGNITGSGPEDYEERARLMEAVDADGNPLWRPNSIKIGGRWWDYNALGPIAFSMGSVANLVDEAEEYANKPADQRGEMPQLALDLAKRQTSTVSQAWYLRGMADILGAVKDGNLGAVGSQIIAGGDRLIPAGGLLNEMRRIEDPIAREVDKGPGGIVERELNRLPFASRQLQPKLGATTGRPIEQPRDILSTVFRGSAPGMTPNPVAMEIARLDDSGNNVPVPREDDMFKGARQSRGQTRAIQEQVGTAVNMYVADIMAKPAYAGMTNAQKANALKSAIGQAREAANITLSDDVARSPHESALLQWAQTPQFQGVSSTLPPEEIARKNWEIQQAKSKLSDYTSKYGENAENRLRKDDPAAAKLAQRERIDSDILARKKKKIDQATGGALTEAEKKAAAGGLVGVGSTTLPAAPPRRAAG